ADLDDLEVILLARLQRTSALQRAARRTVHAHVVAAAPTSPVHDLRVVAEPFDVVAEFHERAEHGDARDFALYDLAHLVLLEPVAPDVVDLFHAQRHAAAIRIDAQHLRRNRLALLKDFMRILDALRPADIADVHQAVESVFQFDERAEFHN